MCARFEPHQSLLKKVSRRSQRGSPLFRGWPTFTFFVKVGGRVRSSRCSAIRGVRLRGCEVLQLAPTERSRS